MKCIYLFGLLLVLVAFVTESWCAHFTPILSNSRNKPSRLPQTRAAANVYAACSARNIVASVDYIVQYMPVHFLSLQNEIFSPCLR